MGSTKDSKDQTRAERKLKKRKLEEAVFDLPGKIDTPVLSIQAKEGREKSYKKRKLSVRSTNGIELHQDGERSLRLEENDGEQNGKDSRREFQSQNEEPASVTHRISRDSASLEGEAPPPKKTKRERKAERKAAKVVEAASSNNSEDLVIDSGADALLEKSKKHNNNRERMRKGESRDGNPGSVEGKSPRFIVFIGNLPFGATTESIKQHFVAVHPKSIRHLTKKDEPQKSKGCAFLEFEGYDNMKACLKSYHHSIFDDGVSAPRKINVELTAGGGGNKQNRQSKIHEKNQKLNEQRIRRRQEEDKARLGKTSSTIDQSDVHPDRRARVPDIQ